MRKLAVFLLLLLPMSSVSSGADLPQVFQIVADECSHGPRRVQTGFLADGHQGLITALHGVLGCNTLQARRAADERPISGLKIVEVDIERDVALLSSAGLQKSELLGLPTGPVPAPGAKLWIVGHPQGFLVQHRIDLTLESSTKYLEDLLPADRNLVQILLSRASPAIGIPVLSLTGDIQPGHSGAPILDQAGRVVGIGNGGLKGGTVGIGWGIPLVNLELVPREKRQTRMATLLQQSPTLLFDFAVAEDVSFSVSPPRTAPGEELTLHLSGSLQSDYVVYLGDRGPLPKKTMAGGEVVVITVPSDIKSGDYDLEIRHGGRQILSTNKVTIENWLDTFEFSVTPPRVATGGDVTLHLNYPAPVRYFDIFLKGYYGRVNRKLYRKATLSGGSQVVVTIPDDLVDFEFYIELSRGNLRYTAPVCVDNPNYHTASPPC